MTDIERVYVTRDNTIRMQLLNDDVAFTAVQMAAIDAVEVIYKGQSYHSDDYPAAFNWETYAADGIVEISLGGILDESGSDRNAKLIIYTDDYPNGLVMGSLGLIADSTAIAAA
jgi:hypothetical protein